MLHPPVDACNRYGGTVKIIWFECSLESQPAILLSRVETLYLPR